MLSLFHTSRSKAGGLFPSSQLLTTYWNTRSLARSASKVCAILLESRKPCLAICFSRPAIVASSVKTPSTPGALKSVWVLRNVADLIELSPIAALWASPIAVKVPPRQTETVLTSGAPVISRTIRTASSGPCCR